MAARPEVVADPLPATDFLRLVPEIALAAIRRFDRETPELVDAPWRDRTTEAALLELELRRRLEPAGRAPFFDEPDLARYAAWFEALCRQDVPIRTVQHVLRAAVARSFAELWARAQPGDVMLLLGTAWRMSQYGVLERVLVRAFQDARPPGARRPPDSLLPIGGLPVRLPAGAHLVVVPDRPVDDAEGLPAGTVAAVLDGRCHLLVPLTGDEADTRRQVADWVAAWSGLHAAATVARSAADLLTAATAAQRILATAVAIGHPPGLVGPRELGLEASLLADPVTTAWLASVLRPLEDEPRLLQTLLVFLARDLDRSRTAADVHLSRGGLTVRLDRIAKLTGWDPRTVRGVQVLTTAVSARALQHAVGRPSGTAT